MEKFTSKTSFIMASVGSAVGLGNVFRFPALTLKYGGIFIVFYILFLGLMGTPLLMSELALGRISGRSAVGSFCEVSQKGRFAGILSSFNSFFIMTYYCPLFAAVLLAAVFSFRLARAPAPERVFTDILYGENILIPLLFLVVAWALVTLCFGDAERLGKISLFGVVFASAIIFGMAIFSVISRFDAVLSLLSFSFSPVFTPHFWTDLLGQVFFSLSVMVGVMVSYGAYLPAKENIFSCALTVSVADLLVSLCASVIYAAFAQGGTSGDLLLCFSLYPAAFCSLGRGVGSALSFLFYSALALLCLPSVFSYLKAVCHAVTDIRGGNSVKIGLALTLISGFFGTFLLGDKGLSRLTFLDSEIACLLILFAGLFETPIFMKAVREKALLEEINRGGKTGLSAGFYRFSIGFLSPAVILLLIFAKIFF